MKGTSYSLVNGKLKSNRKKHIVKGDNNFTAIKDLPQVSEGSSFLEEEDMEKSQKEQVEGEEAIDKVPKTDEEKKI